MKTNIARLGTTAGAYDDWHEGRDPAGITTQDPVLSARLDPIAGSRKLANYLSVMTLEAQTIARACGKSHLHNLEPEDLAALTIEAAAMARVPLAGTSWIPGPDQYETVRDSALPDLDSRGWGLSDGHLEGRIETTWQSNIS